MAHALVPALAALLLVSPLALACDEDGPTACTHAGLPLAVHAAAGTLDGGESAAHPVDGALGKSVVVWPQFAPDAHGPFSWTLRDRATGATLGSGGAVEVPTPRFLGVSPYDDLCLEVTNGQGNVVEYAVAVTLLDA